MSRARPPQPATAASGAPPGLEARRGPQVEVLTTEGVAIRFRLGLLGARTGAFLLDLLLCVVLLVAGALVLALLGGGFFGVGWGTALFLLLQFCVRHFWFTAHEIRSNGRTPGKRAAGLRVIDAEGGALTAQAVVARNAVRVVEFDLPLLALGQPELFFGAAPVLLRWIGVGWLLFFVILPTVTPRRQRLGDLVAGTLVVEEPVARLLPDIGQAALESTEGGAAEFVFEPRQLETYGEYELQVLEDLLRRPADRTSASARAAVAARIARKIGWPAAVPPARVDAFLRAFYAQMRAHHERRLLFGRRKRHKFESD